MIYLFIFGNLILLLVLLKHLLFRKQLKIRVIVILVCLGLGVLFNIVMYSFDYEFDEVINIDEHEEIMKIVIIHYPDEPVVIYDRKLLDSELFSIIDTIKLKRKFIYSKTKFKDSYVNHIIISLEKRNIMFDLNDNHILYNRKLYELSEHFLNQINSQKPNILE